MLPITKGIPKPSIPFLTKPLLHWTLETLERAGIDRVFINLHHLSGQVKSCAESYSGALDISFSYESKILGTAGLFVPIRSRIEGKTFLATNSDIIHTLSMGKLENDLDGHPEALVSLALGPRRPGYTPVELSPSGSVTTFGYGDKIFLGTYAARRELLSYLHGKAPSEFVSDLIAPLLPSGVVRGLSLDGEWLDLGSPASYLDGSLASIAAPSKWPAFPLPPGCDFEERCGHRVLRHESARISRDAFFTGPAVVGRDCKVEAGTRLGRAVLLVGSTLKEGDRLHSAILSPSGRIEGQP